MKQADAVLAFNRQVYEEGRNRQVGLDALNKQVVNLQMGIAQDQRDRATDTWNFYQSQGRPMVQRAFADANQYDGEENLAAARGRAAATVEQQFSNIQGQQTRALQRLGINPNSGKFLALQQRLATDKALALTGAANNADEQRRQGAIGLRQNAANLAQGFPAQVNGQAGSSSAAGNAALNGNASIAGQNLAVAGQALGGMSAAGGIYGSAANGYSNLFGGAQSAANQIGAQNAQAQAGWGQLAGMGMSMWKGATTSNMGSPSWGSNMGGLDQQAGGPTATTGFDRPGEGYADGGRIRGPGSGTSDSVPAVNGDTGQPIRLSNVEYIVSADVVRAKGVEFFDRLQKKHHTPVKHRRNLR
ncbi:MAG TPA: hypothetical protein VD932_02040 [Aquabacterium sp.]|nr:hypothetical protein [Aquabacterium sp.]